MKICLVLALLVTSFFSCATGTIDFLEVDKDVVIFSTSGNKSGPLPNCVSSSRENLWSISLENESGRAIYSLILTGMAKGETVEFNVESAGDCDALSGYERAEKVNLLVVSAPSKGTIGVYKADGKTRLGALFSHYKNMYFIDDSGSRWSTESRVLNYFPYNEATGLWFASIDCTGQPLHTHLTVHYRNPSYKDGKYLKANPNSQERRLVKSEFHANGNCNRYDVDTFTYELFESEHPVCGENLCIIKAE